MTGFAIIHLHKGLKDITCTVTAYTERKPTFKILLILNEIQHSATVQGLKCPEW